MDQIVDRNLLPEGLADWIESVTDGKLIAINPHAGVGVSREGCFVQVEKDEEELDLYLAYDVRRVDDIARQDFLRREAAAQRVAVNNGIRAPQPVGRWPEKRAILTRKLGGDVHTDQLSEETKVSLAQDYIGDIAKLHRIDVESLGELDGFGDPIPPQDYIRKRIAYFRQRHHGFGHDEPYMVLVYKWLEKNIPKKDIPVSIVQGDVGPGNFLHDGSKVTAVLDWEQAHFGDPLEDFGWLMLRLALFPYSSIAPWIAAYKKAGGYEIDPERILYYRVMCKASSMTDMCGQLVQSDKPFAGNLGHVYRYYFALRKLMADSLAESVGLEIPPVVMPKSRKVSWERLYRLGVDELLTNIGPRSSDKVGSARSESMTALVHFWLGRELYGDYSDGEELKAIEELLGTQFSSLDVARSQFAAAIDNDDIDMNDAIVISVNRVSRDVYMAREGLGHLADSAYSPLTAD